MVDTAHAPNYDSLIDRQHKRIVELEADLARCTTHIRKLKLKTRVQDPSSVFAAHDLARLHAAHMHAMLAMAPSLHPITAPHPLQMAAAAAAAAANMPLVPGAGSQMQGAMHFSGAQLFAGAAAATGGDEEDKAGKSRYWTAKEHQQFLYAVKLFGAKNYVAISQFVGTRTPKQVRTHAQKYQMKLEREAKKRRNQALAAAAAAAAAASSSASAVQKKEEPQDAAQSESTCPMDDVNDCASSPVSIDDEDCASEEVCVTDVNDRLMSNTAPAPVTSTSCAGMKKDSSLTNLADYDDFMRRITTAVQDDRGQMFDDRDADLDVDILNGAQKNGQFDDSLLADL